MYNILVGEEPRYLEACQQGLVQHVMAYLEEKEDIAREAALTAYYSHVDMHYNYAAGRCSRLRLDRSTKNFQTKEAAYRRLERVVIEANS